MSALLAAILKGFGDFLARLVADWRRDRDLQDKGRAEGSADLNRGIAGVADDQAKNNAVERGGAAGVLERLRKRPRPDGAGGE
ncbi:MAG: hypothetical protein INF18_00875 [Methylobacterium sp.]|nr:hypothetical protein [Methylobacterium sp.]